MGSRADEADDSPLQCGADAAKHFAFADGYRNLNHGSYGTYPKEVRSVLRDFQERVEARPDNFIRHEYRTGLLDKSRAAIADYLGIPPNSCALVPNATTGVETVLRNLVFEEGEVMICFPDVYPAFANTMDYLSKRSPLEFRQIDYTLPVSDDHVCEMLENTINAIKSQNKRPKVALFDTISSIPGARMPFERLTAICRSNNVLALIDGAHSAGQIPLDLNALDPDFFVSNLHKWGYVPRGCAVLYVPERNHHIMKTTLPTSFGYGASFANNFSDTGTLDNTPYICVPAALNWRKRLMWGDKKGDEAVKAYLPYLAREGGAAVAKYLGTEVLENDERTLGNCSLTNVRLPLSVDGITGGDSVKVEKITAWMMRHMIEENETAVYVYSYGGNWWVRLSAQVYLTKDDFMHAAKMLEKTCQRVKDGSWQGKDVNMDAVRLAEQ
ncbi:uncharacterized protein LTR77_008856 [Saxophila tyrrhenica]|uniref:Aminotransferase class V domain-containing protein n=1 Tax=Saxophila tyrrhenica TaxID=1690608 RepID=A0AAV9P0G8_9PEZI|nr:hypothetical protein LTR77_008856 [Saxophila tyrrhenica]